MGDGVHSAIFAIYRGADPYKKFFEDLKDHGYFPKDTVIDLDMFRAKINRSKTSCIVWTIFIFKNIKGKTIDDLRRWGVIRGNTLGRLSQRVYSLSKWVKKICTELTELTEYSIRDFINRYTYDEILKYADKPISEFPRIYQYLCFKAMSDEIPGAVKSLKMLRNRICQVKPIYTKDIDVYPWNMLTDLFHLTDYVEKYGMETLMRNETAVSRFLTMLMEYGYKIPYGTANDNIRHFDMLLKCGEKYDIDTQPREMTSLLSLYLYYQKGMSFTDIGTLLDRSKTNISNRIHHSLRVLRGKVWHRHIMLGSFFSRDMNKLMERLSNDTMGILDQTDKFGLFAKAIRNPLIFDMITNDIALVTDEYTRPARIICHESSTPESLPLPQSIHYRYTSTSTTLDDEVVAVKMWDNDDDRDEVSYVVDDTNNKIRYFVKEYRHK